MDLVAALILPAQAPVLADGDVVPVREDVADLVDGERALVAQSCLGARVQSTASMYWSAPVTGYFGKR